MTIKNILKDAFKSLAILAAITMVSCGNAQAGASEVAVEEDTAVDPNNGKAPFEIKDGMIFNENIPVVVDFYADWCGPCRQYAPVFHEIANKYAQSACFVSLNIEEYPQLQKTYRIESIPATVFIMPGGGVLGKEVGILTPQRLQELVDQLVATSAGIDMQL